MELYNRFLSRCTKTGGYKKSEDGEFLATGGSPYILLTPESCDSYGMTLPSHVIIYLCLFGYLRGHVMGY